MPARTPLSCFLAFALFIIMDAAPAQAQQADAAQRSGSRAVAAHSARFVENRGQWHADVRFASRTDGMDLWVTNNRLYYDMYRIERRDGQRPASRTGHVVSMEFVGATGGAAEGAERVPGVHHFLIGNDAARWVRDVSSFKSARINGIYKGVDAVVYHDGTTPRYDLVLRPGANPATVRLRFSGADTVRPLGADGLLLGTTSGRIEQRGLFAYQLVDGQRRRVACSFAVAADGTVGFDVGGYDATRPLVIDPLVYSSYLGGSGDDAAYSVTVDNAGNAYVAGYVSSWQPAPSDSFPRTVGAYDRTYNGGTVDAFVTKFDCLSDTLVYSTLIGGDSYEDARQIVLDAQNNAYVCGYTGSQNFPTTGGAYMQTYAGGISDAFVLKLNPSGSALVFSTFIGGNIAEGAYAIGLANDASVRVAGYTASANFPVTAGAYDTLYNGAPGDVFVATLSPNGGALLSSTFVGGANNDVGFAMTLDGNGNAWVTGTTASNDFPTVGGPFDATFNGGTNDMFLLCMNPSNSALLYSTYYGGGNEDQANAIDYSGNGSVTICGYSGSRDFPTTPGAYQTAYGGGAYDAVVFRYDINAGAIAWSTYVGRSSDDYGFGVSVTPGGDAYICGNTISGNFPTTPDAYDRVHKTNSYDAYIAVLNPAGSSLLYSTFVGGGDRDLANSIRYRGADEVYIAGTTKSQNFPTTRRRWSDSLGRARNGNQETFSYDAFVTKLDMRNVVVTAPDQAKLLCGGAIEAIRWASPRVGAVKLELINQANGNRTVVAASVQATAGTFDWTVAGNLAPGSYRFRVVDVSDTAVYGESALLTVPPRPAIAGAPGPQTLCVGAPLQLQAGATGLGLRYQWRRGGAPIAGATASSYRIAATTVADSGMYDIVVTDTCGATAEASARISFHPAPTIVTAPGSQAACVGTAATFAVVTAGGSPRYQWKKNGAPIAGATGASFTIASVVEADAGDYSVEIAYDPCAAQPITATASLSVGRMDITAQPQEQRVALGGSATFSVTATGAGLAYLWLRNGTPISNATGPSLTISPVTAADSGLYEVVITGPCTRRSQGARLVITGPGAVPAAVAAGLTIAVAPNPARNEATVTIAGGTHLRNLAGLDLSLYDMSGRRVLNLTPLLRAADYRSARIDVRSLAAGVYYCRISGSGWNGIATRVIIER